MASSASPAKIPDGHPSLAKGQPQADPAVGSLGSRKVRVYTPVASALSNAGEQLTTAARAHKVALGTLQNLDSRFYFDARKETSGLTAASAATALNELPSPSPLYLIIKRSELSTIQGQFQGRGLKTRTIENDEVLKGINENSPNIEKVDVLGNVMSAPPPVGNLAASANPVVNAAVQDPASAASAPNSVASSNPHASSNLHASSNPPASAPAAAAPAAPPHPQAADAPTLSAEAVQAIEEASRLRPEEFRTKYPSYNAAAFREYEFETDLEHPKAKNIMMKLKLYDVQGDGNCGFYSLVAAKMKAEGKNITLPCFKQAIYVEAHWLRKESVALLRRWLRDESHPMRAKIILEAGKEDAEAYLSKLERDGKWIKDGIIFTAVSTLYQRKIENYDHNYSHLPTTEPRGNPPYKSPISVINLGGHFNAVIDMQGVDRAAFLQSSLIQLRLEISVKDKKIVPDEKRGLETMNTNEGHPDNFEIPLYINAIYHFTTMPKGKKILADTIENLRAFGAENEAQSFMRLLLEIPNELNKLEIPTEGGRKSRDEYVTLFNKFLEEFSPLHSLYHPLKPHLNAGKKRAAPHPLQFRPLG